MFYYLSILILERTAETPWADSLSWLRVFRYITLRSAGAAITALVLSLWLGPRIIEWLKRLKMGQNYEDRAQAAGGLAARTHDKKQTPIMGGLLIVLTLDISTLLWAQWNAFVLLTLLCLVVLAALGFHDDYLKITKRSSDGATEMTKLAIQFGLGLFVGIYLWMLPSTNKLITEIMVPFLKHPILTGATATGLILSTLTIVGSSNAVNLTDGLDGLAIGCTLIVALVFVILTYIAGNAKVSGYLQVPYVPGAGELTVFSAALLGAGLGFLWFNCHPAMVFMGDTGSLALGGALGIMAVLIHQPFTLVIAGAVFVAEALSVLIQRSWFKYTKRRTGTGRRVFLMAPLHHHFEKLGWHESQVVTRFHILCILCALLALSTLKLR